MADIKHLNCFDFTRLIAALMVIYSHAYAIDGLAEPNLRGIFSLGGLGVAIFFSISGYLITQSWLSDPHLPRFFLRRALRIFPALIVVILLSVFVLGPAMTTLPASQYFSNHMTYVYLRNIVLLADYYLPGVFEHAPVPNAVNGSLWSLPAEFLMYLIVMAFGLVRIISKRWLITLFTAAQGGLGLYLAASQPGPILFCGMDLHQVLVVSPYFWAGSALYLFRDTIRLTMTITIVVFAILFALPPGPVLVAWSWFAIPYISLAFATQSDQRFQISRRIGDLSYGLYIYAFPIQQTAFQLLKDTLTLHELIVLTMAASALFAFISWHLIEHPALRLKPKQRRPLLITAAVRQA